MCLWYMKSLLLAACITAIATAASARPWQAYHCGKVDLAYLPPKYFDPKRDDCGPCDGKGHFFDMKNDPDEKNPLADRHFRWTKSDLLYKGKKCEPFTEDEY